MPKAELYKISVTDGKVMLRIPEQLVGAETADMDDIQAELHMMDVDYVPEELLDIYNRTSGDFDFLTDVKTQNFTLQIELSDDQSKAYLNVIPPKEIIREFSKITKSILELNSVIRQISTSLVSYHGQINAMNDS